MTTHNSLWQCQFTEFKEIVDEPALISCHKLQNFSYSCSKNGDFWNASYSSTIHRRDLPL